MLPISALPYFLYFLAYMIMGALVHGIWRYHQTKRLLLPHLMAWFGSGALRYLLVLGSVSTQTWVEKDIIVLVVRLMVLVELSFFVRAFWTWITESVEIRSGSYRELANALTQFLANQPPPREQENTIDPEI